MNRNRTTTNRTSPGRDPVLLAIKAACVAAAIVVVILAWGWVRPFVAVAMHHCPPGSHAVWLPSFSQASCGDSLGVGVKSR